MNTLIAIGSLGILVLLLEVFGARKTIIPVTIIGLLATLGISFGGFYTESGSASFLNNMLVEDKYSMGFSSLFIVLTLFLVLMSGDFYSKEKSKLSDFISIKIFLLFAGVAMVSFGNLATYFVGIEILSISLYVLAASNPLSLKSNEAGMKYFLMGAFASGILLFGIALIYGATGSFDMEVIHQAGMSAGVEDWFYIGVAMVSVAMFFKIAAVPFHLWAPDVYQGSPTLVTTLMSTLAKVIAIGGFYRLLSGMYGNFSDGFITTIMVISILSMTVGNIMALRQDNVKRMLAYSGISHAGFMLMAILAIPSGASDLFYYAVAYSVAGIAAFAVVIAVTKDKDDELISHFNGLGKRSPILALSLTVALMSLAGIPVLAGFFGKVFLFSRMLEMSHVTLVIIAVINSFIAVGYYFKLILAMYTKPDTEGKLQSSPVYTITAVITVILLTLFGIFPDWILGLL
ncbi:MAG: NADH-quinone oxidoreductase subunit N [Flavobacteriaceae bacterium]